MTRKVLAFLSLVIFMALSLGVHPLGPGQTAEGDELLSQVTIYRDTYGIPHVLGETEEAAMFGDGYAQGQERGERIIPAIVEAAQRRPVTEAQYQTLPAQVLRNVEAFTAGLNFYISEHRQELPSGARALTPLEVVAWMRILRAGAGEGASNSFVVSGQKMVSGNVVVADPHRPFKQEPEIHVKGGDLNFAGLLAQNSMFIEIGHNGYIAWGGSAHPHRMVPLGDSLESITTHYGMMKAKSIAELKRVLSSLELPQEPHIVAGDRDGNIFYVAFGKIPAQDHAGYLRFEELPQIENPASGFVQTSNEVPWLVSPEASESIDPQFYWRHFQPGRPFDPEVNRGTWRGRRLTQVLSSQEKFTLEEIHRVAFDTYIGMAGTLKNLIFAGYEENKGTLGALSEPTAKAVEILRSWDNVSRKESTAMTIFKLWFERYRKLGGSIRVGELKEPTPEERRRAFQALRETVEFMLRQYGSVEVEWGRVHLLQRGDKLFPMGAAEFEFQTVHIASATGPRSGQGRYENGIWYTNFGSSYMFMAELGRPVRAWSVKPNSQTDDFNSVHSWDQSELFSKMEMKPLWFTEEEVLSHVESAWGTRIKLGTKAVGYEAELTFMSPTEMRPLLTDNAPAPLPAGWKAASSFLTLEPSATKVQGQLRFYLPAGVGDVAVFRLSDGGWQRVETGGRAEDFVWAEIEALGTYVALEQEKTAGQGSETALNSQGLPSESNTLALLERADELPLPIGVGIVDKAFLPYSGPPRTLTRSPGQPQIPSNAEISGWIQDLWRMGANSQYGYRMPGTPAGHQGARYILEKFREFGLQDPFLEPISAPLSLPEKWRLTIRTGEKEEVIPSHFVRYAGFTPPEGITAPMVYVGQGSAAEFQAKDAAVGIRGKIVVVDVVAPGLPRSMFLPNLLFEYDPDKTLGEMATEYWPPENLREPYARAKAYGAAGYVGILTFRVNDNNQYLHGLYADGILPGLFISPNHGTYLKSLLAAGPVEANLLLTGGNTTGTLYHVFGFLPGKSEEIIVVHTHHDGWAVNEASGAAVVMALAKYFAQFPKESRERTLLFVAFDSHFGKRSVGEFLGSVQPRIVAAIVIEMIAKEFKIVEGKYVDTGLVSPTHFGIPGGQPHLVSFVQEAVIKHHLDRSVGTPRTFGEGGVYAGRGIPTIERIAISAPQFSNDDTPDKVMVDKLQPTAAAFVDIIRNIDATPRELLDLKPASGPDDSAANVNLQQLKTLSVSKGIDYFAEYANNPRYPNYGGPYYNVNGFTTSLFTISTLDVSR